MFFIPLSLGLNIEDIQYTGSSVVDFFADIAVMLYETLGSIGSSTVSSTETPGIDLPPVAK
ncbi:hypothetical protein ACMG4H_14825 [Corynebacterium glutamicum]|uniref:hypothetical protein n=1 Tax=Corynebacterium glutamicum TaxID=1718 RepID=UPI003C7988D7